MKTMLNAFLLLAATQLLCNGAFAACGGGGNHAKAPAPAPAAAAPTAVLSVAAEQPVDVAVAETAIAAGFDSSSFDAVSAKLKLSKSQAHDLDNAKSDIRDELEKLAKAHDKAQAKLAKCHGDCQDKVEKVEQTAQALNSYNPYTAFESKLSRILSAAQYQTYSDRAHAKSTVSLADGKETAQR